MTSNVVRIKPYYGLSQHLESRVSNLVFQRVYEEIRSRLFTETNMRVQLHVEHHIELEAK